MKRDRLFPRELALNINIGDSNFAVPWGYHEGLRGRIISLAPEADDEEERCVCRRQRCSVEEISQEAYDAVFTAPPESDELIEHIEPLEFGAVEGAEVSPDDEPKLYCHYRAGAVSVAAERYEAFSGKVEDTFGAVEVVVPSKHQKHRIPPCKICGN